MSRFNPANFFIATIIGIIIYIVLDVIVQSLPPYYNPITQAESFLAVGPYGYIMTVNFLVRGFLSLSFILGLIFTFKTRKSSYNIGLILLGVWSFGAIILAFFPADVSISIPVTLHGTIHLITALLAFIGGGLGILILSLGMRSDNQFLDIIKYLLPLSIFSVISLVLTFVLLTSPLFGLIERIFIGTVLLWMLIVSIYIIKK
jgi:hypothetical protein